MELDVENLRAKQEPFWNGCLMLIQWIVMNNPTKILKFENHNVFCDDVLHKLIPTIHYGYPSIPYMR